MGGGHIDSRILLVIALELRGPVLAARVSCVWAVIESIGLWSFIVERMGPMTAFLNLRGSVVHVLGTSYCPIHGVGQRAISGRNIASISSSRHIWLCHATSQVSITLSTRSHICCLTSMYPGTRGAQCVHVARERSSPDCILTTGRQQCGERPVSFHSCYHSRMLLERLLMLACFVPGHWSLPVEPGHGPMVTERMLHLLDQT
jgi:hypothetical protein